MSDKDRATCFYCVHCELADWDLYDDEGDEIDTGGVCGVRSDDDGTPLFVGCFTTESCELFERRVGL